MKMKIWVFAVVILCARTVQAEVWCYGTLDGVYVYNDGSVTVHPSWRNDWVRICNLKNNDNGIDTVTCSMWASFSAQAVENRLQTVMYFYGANDCATMPTYSSTPATGYLMLRPKQ